MKTLFLGLKGMQSYKYDLSGKLQVKANCLENKSQV